MRGWLILAWLIWWMPLSLSAQEKVLSIQVDDAITTEMASFIQRGLNQANEEKAEAVIIELNTPGGLLEATRKIVGSIMESPTPVIVFIYPGGSRAGSAGVFITLSAPIAAMAPATNMGAAHPVVLQGQMDSVQNEKATNDALAFIRTIAQKRGRNVELSQEAVLKSISITEKEALEQNMIDLIADHPKDLLEKIDGDTVRTTTGIHVLNVRNAVITPVEMTFSEKITILLSNPNLMYVLLLLGMLGILFEFFNPGALVPGAIGAIALVLSFFSMSILPINYAGLALIGLAMVLFILELKMASHGILAIGAIVALSLGSIMLIQTPQGVDYLKISLGVIITSVILSTLFFLFIIGLGLKAQRNKVVSGNESFIGRIGLALETLAPLGKIKIHGEIWQAESLSGVINKGEKVEIDRVENLKAFVKKVPSKGSTD